jgi:hypothetical protein
VWRIVQRQRDFHGLIGNFRRWRELRQNPPIRAPKLKLAVGQSLDLISLLVDGAVMAAAEHGEVRERGGAAVSPVTYVVALAEPDHAAGKTAAAVSMV